MAKKQKSIYKLYKTQNNEYCSAVKIMQVISSIPLIFTAINQHNLKGDIKNFGNVLMLSFIPLVGVTSIGVAIQHINNANY